MELDSLKRVEIKWMDTTTRAQEWREWGCDDDLLCIECRTIGYVIKETEQTITVCQSYYDDRFADASTIWKPSIVGMKEL